MVKEEWNYLRARALVNASGFTRDRIAKEVGISRRTLSNILQGQVPSLSVVKGLARVLGCGEEDLLQLKEAAS